MEAVAAVSLACNIAQLIDYGKNVIELITQIYRDGSTLDNSDIEAATLRTQELSRILNNSAVQKLQQTPSSRFEKNLLSVTDECDKIAEELIEKLSKLKNSGSKWDRLRTGLGAVRKKSTIERLQKRLDHCETTMESSILATLREQIEASNLVQEKSFETLDSQLKSFVDKLLEGQNQLRDLLVADGDATRTAVLSTTTALSSQIASLKIAIMGDTQRKQLLDSLRYPEMNARRNQIEDADPQTYDSLFNPHEVQHPYSKYKKIEPPTAFRLIDWVERGDGIFWVQGKAGSGKSTFMKHIAQSQEMKTVVSRKHEDFLFVTHFFWLSGSLSQRDFHGMLCSLVYQLVYANEDARDDTRYTDKRITSDWSTKELQEIFLATILAIRKRKKIFILLDALDEYDERYGQQKLIDFIRQMSKHIPICVSSRPEIFWLKTLRENSQLKLQDITKYAIESHVLQEINNTGLYNDSLEDRPMQDIIKTLTDRAQGVFLWVHLALKSVLRGIDYATAHELKTRVEQLPQEIENLYLNMLSKNADEWASVKEDAATFFSIALCTQNISEASVFLDSSSFKIYQYCAIYKAIKKESIHILDKETLERECTKISIKISAICHGMLEIHGNQHTGDPRTDTQTGDEQQQSQILNIVQFSHRTVRDFLVDTPFGRSLTCSEPIEIVALLKTLLEVETLMLQFGLQSLSWPYMGRLLSEILETLMLKNLEHIHGVFLILLVKRYLSLCASGPSKELNMPLASDDYARNFALESYHKANIDLLAHYDRPGSVDLPGIFDLPGSIDFLGMTLVSGTTIYLDHLDLNYNNLSQRYLEYLLFCAAQGIIPPHGSHSYLIETLPLKPLIATLRSKGAKGNTTFYLKRSNQQPWYRDQSLNCTANKILLNYLMHIEQIPRNKAPNFVSMVLECLNVKNLDAHTLYGYFWPVDKVSRQFGFYGVPYYLRDDQYGFYMEANLKYWLWFIFLSLGSMFFDEGELSDVKNLSSIQPFRRLVYIAIGSYRKYVPILRDGQLVKENDNGDRFLQLFEALHLDLQYWAVSFESSKESAINAMEQEFERLSKVIGVHEEGREEYMGREMGFEDPEILSREYNEFPVFKNDETSRDGARVLTDP